VAWTQGAHRKSIYEPSVMGDSHKIETYGGLGVKDFTIMNRALLAKTIWKWLYKEEWILHSLYTMAQNTRPWLHRQTTPLWQMLRQMDCFFLISTEFEIGNGEKTRFWLDNWQGKILSKKYQILFTFVEHQDVMVREAWQHNNW
jgi:hypothetical protein